MNSNGQIIRRQYPDLAGTPAPSFGHVAHIDVLPASHTTESVNYRAMLRRHRTGIVVIFTVSLLASVVVTLLSDKIYRSKTVLEVMAINQDFMNSKNVDPLSSVPSQDSYVETQSKLLVSETVIDRTVNALRTAVPAPLLHRQSWLQKIGRWIGIQGDEQTQSPDSVLRAMFKDMKVKQEGQSSLISVTMYGADPQFTADAINRLAEESIEAGQEDRWAAASRMAEFLTRQLEGSRKKLQASENALQTYANTASLVLTDASHEDVATEKLREIQQELSHAEADRAIKQSQLDILNSSSPDALPEVLDDGALRDYKSRIADLHRQLAELNTTLTPEHYKVRRVESQIADLEQQMARQRANIVQRVRNDYNSAYGREQLLKGAYNAQLARVGRQSAKEVRYNVLKREVDADRESYQSMLQRVKEATVISALHASNLRIVDPAKPPYVPFRPNLPLNLGLGTLSAGILSLLYTLVRERGDRSFRAPGQSLHHVDVPELAVIPSAKPDLRALASADSSQLPKAGLMKRSRRQSLITESFRSAVTSLLMTKVNGAQPRLILITSPHPEAGKTTTAVNLAVALAEIGRRVLVIDGDLRKPRLGPLFGLENAEGLSEILAGTTEKGRPEALIYQTPIPGMFILPGGSKAINIPLLLHSSQMHSLMEMVRDQFEFVLIDSPPMITLTDARLLGRTADGVILVCRAGKTRMDQLLASRRRLAEDGTHVIGTILTDWNPVAEDPSYLNAYNKYARNAAS
jgi:polysaccharide biosynthesis transport protein